MAAPALSASGIISLAAAVEAGAELAAVLGEESLALLHLHALAVVTDVHYEPARESSHCNGGIGLKKKLPRK